MNDIASSHTDWPHSPPHWLEQAGNYIVTGATYQKAHLFRDKTKLHFLHNLLLELALRYEWSLHTWSVFSNHYHFVGSSKDPSNLEKMIRHLHSVTARTINKTDKTPGRQVWWNYWDTHITTNKSWFVRVRYVNENPVRHCIVKHAKNYPFCSAGWLELKASSVFLKQLATFDISNVNVIDDF